MNHFCYVFELLPDVDEEYDRRHAELEPRVIDAMHEAGIVDFRLFRRDRLVIATGTSRVPISDAFAQLDADPANQRWSVEIRALMATATDENGELLFANEIWQLPGEDER